MPAPPAQCSAFELAPKSGAEDACPSAQERWSALERALDRSDAVQRDQLLAKLEPCSVFAPGVLRALRAELVEPACADRLVEDDLEHAGARPRKDVEDALVGLGLAARLSRLVHEPPVFEPPHDKPHFQEFFAAELVPWIRDQAAAIQELSVRGALLAGYGKGIAAIAAGLADMRFVEVVRQVSLPEELARDPELKDVYYASLDQALEPRKARGRDAALVGLRQFAAEGVLRDERVEEARNLLSLLYSGRRIDALDGLLLPELPALAPSTVEQRLAAKLPTFYVGLLLDGAKASEPTLLRALLERGLPASVREGSAYADLSPEARALVARGSFELGRRYWQASDFRAVATQYPDFTHAPSNDLALLSALADTLKDGPNDAADMMRRGPLPPSALSDVSALDALANGKSPVAALAAFDAAYLLDLAPPAGREPAFFTLLAERYRKAAALLKNPSQKRLANERANAARDTARAIH